MFEPTSGMSGRAWISEYDKDDDAVLLVVDWANIKITGRRSSWTTGTMGSHSNLAVETPQAVSAA